MVLVVVPKTVWSALFKTSLTVTVISEFPEVLAIKRSLSSQILALSTLPINLDTLSPFVLIMDPELGEIVTITSSPLASDTSIPPNVSKLVCAPEPELAILAIALELGALIVGALLLATVSTLPLIDQDCAWESTFALLLTRVLLSMRIYSALDAPCTPK